MNNKYQLLPKLSDEEYQSLKADIKDRGVIIPIEVDESGNILDGHHRVRAWNELKGEGIELPDYVRVVRAGMTEPEKRNHIRALNIIRRHLTKDQLKEQWVSMRQDGMTYKAIGDASGVSHETVRQSIDGATFKNLKVRGKDSKKRPARYKPRKPKPPLAPPVSIYAGSSTSEDKATQTAKKKLKSQTDAQQQVQVTMFSHESKDYYTPPQYIEAAKKVMGEIDLDPASCKEAQKWIKAKKYYTVKNDGLSHEWSGKVWLNPPYGKDGGHSEQESWSSRLVEEYRSGNVTEAVLLVKSALGYKWFEKLWWEWPTCFARERLSFIIPDKDKADGQSKMGTAFIYLGNNVDNFKKVFRKFGRVIMPEEEPFE